MRMRWPLGSLVPLRHVLIVTMGLRLTGGDIRGSVLSVGHADMSGVGPLRLTQQRGATILTTEEHSAPCSIKT
jgi:hypothetical protein